MMPKGIRRRLALTMLAVAGLSFAGCSSAQGTGKGGPSPREHKVLLLVRKGLFTKKAKAYPDRLKITGYDVNPNQVVTWSYIHKSTSITFKERDVIGDVDCKDDTGECTLDLKGKKLLKEGETQHVFKYTVTGKDDNEKDLDPNDPDVEIDR